MNHKIQLLNRILLVILVITMVLIAGGTYLIAFHENPPVEFFNLPFPVDKEAYHAGDLLNMEINYCRYSTSTFTAHINFMNELIYAAPEIPAVGSGKIGCGLVKASLKIPNNLPVGKYYIYGKNVYPVNSIATRTVEWSTIEFDIVP